MATTFGEQLLQFARALDSIDSRNFERIRRLVQKYTQKTLEISSTLLLVEAEVKRFDSPAEALTPYGLLQEGEVRVIPIRTQNRKYSGQAAFAYDKGKSLWVVSSSAIKDTLSEAPGYRDLWSGLRGLPRYLNLGHKDIRTSIMIPLRYTNGRVFGLLGFETVERLDITAGAKGELDHLAQALSISYRLLRDSESRAKRTTEGLGGLDEALNHPLIKLTKPSIFLASSERGRADVVRALRDVIAEREFQNTFREIYWKDMHRPGSINQQLLEQLSRCRYGVCYMSEAIAPDKPSFIDNINVVFEAGMLHGRSDIGSTAPASWIPIREAKSPATPFDFASQRMIVVPRTDGDRLDVTRFKTQFRKALHGLIKDGAHP